MLVTQVYEIANTATSEILGGSAIVAENLSNIVDIGNAVIDSNNLDNYVRKLVDKIGKTIFVNRAYSGGAPSVLMDGWEWGSILEKINAKIPEASENESWQLTDGSSYDPYIFYSPDIDAKFFNKRVTFEIPMSFTEKQVKESFRSPEQLNGFYSMLYNAIDKSMTVKTDALIMRTINNFIGETLYAEAPTGTYTERTGVKAVNLLYLYNQTFGETLTVAKALTTPEFIRFAALNMSLYMERLTKISTLFNIGGTEKFTPKDLLHFVTLADFKAAAEIYLQSDTYHDEYTRLPKSETVPYWQGSGTGYDFSDISSIEITTAGGNPVSASGILAVMFDRDALGVTNLDRWTNSIFNPKADFYNNFYKFTAGYFNDLNENGVVFYIA